MSAPIPSTSLELDDTKRKRIWIVEAYWFFQRSTSRVVREFRNIFPNSTTTDKQVLREVKKLHDHATLHDLRKNRSCRPSSANTPENAELVDEHFTEHPEMSTRRAAQELGISRTSMQRILKTKLKLFPYKIQMFQQLTAFDMQRRVEFADRMLGMMSDGSIRTERIWFSDEAHFWLNGHVNKQNHHFWARENPHIFETTTLKPEKLTVWCAISEVGIVGPYFFDQTVNGPRYLEMLTNDFFPVIQGMDAIDHFWFQQDGALPHRTNLVFEALEEFFDNRVIGLSYEERTGLGMDWPPYSPDLTPCDFFLWGYLKDKVYGHKPRNIEQLKDAIIHEVNAIDREKLKNVIQGFDRRLAAVKEKNGGHIEAFKH